MSYSRPGPVWAVELGLIFFLGFFLATALWLGLWFFHARTAQASALDEKDNALEACQTERLRLSKQFSEVTAQHSLAEQKLREAQIGWGRCIRAKGEAASAETARVSQP